MTAEEIREYDYPDNKGVFYILREIAAQLAGA